MKKIFLTALIALNPFAAHAYSVAQITLGDTTREQGWDALQMALKNREIKTQDSKMGEIYLPCAQNSSEIKIQLLTKHKNSQRVLIEVDCASDAKDRELAIEIQNEILCTRAGC